MGLYDFMLGWLGFEGNKEKKPKKKKEKQQKSSCIQAKFNLNDNTASKTEKVSLQTKNIDTATQEEEAANKNIAVFCPASIVDLKGIIDFTRKRHPAIVNLSSLDEDDFDNGLQFLMGAMYAMRGSVKKLDGKTFLVAPEGSATIINQ